MYQETPFSNQKPQNFYEKTISDSLIIGGIRPKKKEMLVHPYKLFG